MGELEAAILIQKRTKGTVGGRKAWSRSLEHDESPPCLLLSSLSGYLIAQNARRRRPLTPLRKPDEVHGADSGLLLDFPRGGRGTAQWVWTGRSWTRWS